MYIYICIYVVGCGIKYLLMTIYVQAMNDKSMLKQKIVRIIGKHL